MYAVEKDLGFLYHSNIKEADRSALRTSFENNGEDVEGKEYHVLCTVPNALGAGVTLTQASIVVFMEPWGKPTDVEQAWKRCHRVGQKKQVYVFNIDCADRVKGVPAENVVLNRGNLRSMFVRGAFSVKGDVAMGDGDNDEERLRLQLG